MTINNKTKLSELMKNPEATAEELFDTSRKLFGLLSGKSSAIGLTCITMALLEILKELGKDIDSYASDLKKCRAEQDKIEAGNGTT